jgi:hypothetical protein
MTLRIRAIRILFGMAFLLAAAPAAREEPVEELLHRLCATYPVPSIRHRLQDLCGDIEAGRIRLALVPKRLETQEHGIASGMLDADGHATLSVYLPLVEKMRERDAGFPGLFDDSLASILLHERYHIVDQKLRIGAATPDVLVEAERDCWWFTVEELILPMRRAGRLSGYGPNSSFAVALRAYQEARGDKHSVAWTRFAILSTGIKKERLEAFGVVMP